MVPTLSPTAVVAEPTYAKLRQTEIPELREAPDFFLPNLRGPPSMPPSFILNLHGPPQIPPSFKPGFVPRAASDITLDYASPNEAFNPPLQQ